VAAGGDKPPESTPLPALVTSQPSEPMVTDPAPPQEEPSLLTAPPLEDPTSLLREQIKSMAQQVQKATPKPETGFVPVQRQESSKWLQACAQKAAATAPGAVARSFSWPRPAAHRNPTPSAASPTISIDAPVVQESKAQSSLWHLQPKNEPVIRERNSHEESDTSSVTSAAARLSGNHPLTTSSGFSRNRLKMRQRGRNADGSSLDVISVAKLTAQEVEKRLQVATDAAVRQAIEDIQTPMERCLATQITTCFLKLEQTVCALLTSSMQHKESAIKKNSGTPSVGADDSFRSSGENCVSEVSVPFTTVTPPESRRCSETKFSGHKARIARLARRASRAKADRADRVKRSSANLAKAGSSCDVASENDRVSSISGHSKLTTRTGISPRNTMNAQHGSEAGADQAKRFEQQQPQRPSFHSGLPTLDQALQQKQAAPSVESLMLEVADKILAEGGLMERTDDDRRTPFSPVLSSMSRQVSTEKQFSDRSARLSHANSAGLSDKRKPISDRNDRSPRDRNQLSCQKSPVLRDGCDSRDFDGMIPDRVGITDTAHLVPGSTAGGGENFLNVSEIVHGSASEDGGSQGGSSGSFHMDDDELEDGDASPGSQMYGRSSGLQRMFSPDFFSTRTVTSVAALRRSRVDELLRLGLRNADPDTFDLVSKKHKIISKAFCVCGILPWCIGGTSRIYKAFSSLYQRFILACIICAAGLCIWTLVHERHFGDGCSPPDCYPVGVLADVTFSMGAVCGLLSLQTYVGSKTLLTLRTLLASYAQKEDFTNTWMLHAQRDLIQSLAAWSCAVAARLAAEGFTLHAFACILCQTIIVGLTACILLQIRCLTVMVDTFCVKVVRCSIVEEMVFEWNVLQAALRKASVSLETCIFVLQSVAMMSIVVGCFEAVQDTLSDHRQYYSLCSWGFIAVDVYRIIFRTGSVTDKCTRVPSLINSFSLEMDQHRRYIVEYIIHSAAGFHVFEMRLDSVLAFKWAYLSCVAAFVVATKFSVDTGI